MDKERAGDAWRAAAGYDFVPTDGRTEVLEAFDNVITVLKKRAEEHGRHGNRELRELALRFAQRSMGDVELLCQKWVNSDSRGMTY